eukprot:snap_masked-scaffold_8-processed-gene-10.49-mRNA-1 protein AED:1.00 eAED:1.00 QI:0/0/0/0/1/1/2/0/70
MYYHFHQGLWKERKGWNLLDKYFNKTAVTAIYDRDHTKFGLPNQVASAVSKQRNKICTRLQNYAWTGLMW